MLLIWWWTQWWWIGRAPPLWDVILFTLLVQQLSKTFTLTVTCDWLTMFSEVSQNVYTREKYFLYYMKLLNINHALVSLNDNSHPECPLNCSLIMIKIHWISQHFPDMSTWQENCIMVFNNSRIPRSIFRKILDNCFLYLASFSPFFAQYGKGRINWFLM